MKIIDKYIMSSVTTAFIAGVTMFMVLLCAMGLLKELISLITESGVPTMMAIKIFAYKIPGMLVYAFPMAVLLAILLTFSNMSANSEMVAIRAAGVSFVRIVFPLLFVSLAIMALTFYVADYYAPDASQKSEKLMEVALRHVKKQTVNLRITDSNDNVKYTIQSPEINASENTMMQPTIVYYNKNIPYFVVYADKAIWDDAGKNWQFYKAIPTVLYGDIQSALMDPQEGGMFFVSTDEFNIDRSPDDISITNRDPANYTSKQIREYIQHQKDIDGTKHEICKWSTRLAQRYALPFTCIVFTLIGAALGLRHHRTSGAIGLGISIIVIFVYYFLAIYISTFGDNGVVSPIVAAWSPVVVGTVLGVILVGRANK